MPRPLRLTVPLASLKRPLPSATSSARLPRFASLGQLSVVQKRTFIWRRTPPHPDQPMRNLLFLRGRHPGLRFIGFTVFSVVFGSVVIVGGLLLYDASTYRNVSLGDIPVNPLAIHLERGGKKNLPIARMLLDDDENESAKELIDKPKLVILGGGWGAVAILKHLHPGDYHVVVVAPSNYTLFTPLLPSATVGTVEVRSLVEPLRKIVARVRGHYLQAACVDIDVENQLVEIHQDGQKENIYLPYDKAIIAVGSVSNDHGVPGLQNCHQLKTVPDALGIRRKIMENLEHAALPGVDEKEREEYLNFVVCGGGPTGVEFASELYDMINEDVLDYFPKILRKQAKVHIIQSRDHILNTYAEKISNYAEAKFERTGIDTILNARVKEVKPDCVLYTTKGEKGETITHSIPTRMVLWSTGIAMNPFTRQVASELPNQYHKHALEVDSHLRVMGAPLGTLYAIGDASTIDTNLLDHLIELVDRFDKDRNGKIDFEEFGQMMKSIQRKFPTSQIHVEKMHTFFDDADKDKDGQININELTDMLTRIQSKLTALPATAQVASQQGRYLGKKLSKLARSQQKLESLDQLDDPEDTIAEPFSYLHLGSLAYIGNSAVFDFPGFSLTGQLMAMYLWRSIYLSESVSVRTRLLLLVDWVKRALFGRDLSKF